MKSYNQIVQLPGRAGPTPPPPWRRLLLIVAVGVGCALVVFLLGRDRGDRRSRFRRIGRPRPRSGQRAGIVRRDGPRAPPDGARPGRSADGRYGRRVAIPSPRDGCLRRRTRRSPRHRTPTTRSPLTRSMGGRWPGTDGHRSCRSTACRVKRRGFLRGARSGLRLVYVTPVATAGWRTRWRGGRRAVARSSDGAACRRRRLSISNPRCARVDRAAIRRARARDPTHRLSMSRRRPAGRC